MAITSISSVIASIAAVGTMNRTITGIPDDLQTPLSVRRSTTYTYGTSGADTIDQATTFIFTATNNTTTRLDLSTASGSAYSPNPPLNMVGESSPAFTKIKWMMMELLSTTQDTTNGTACSSVTISPAGSNPITTSPLGSAKTYTMTNGDKWVCEKHNSGGITVANGSADGFDVLNNDASVSGKIRVTLLGNA